MKILNKLLCKFFKKQSTEQEDIIAYYHIFITKDNNLVISGDFTDGNESVMAKLVFMLCSGSLTNYVLQVVEDKCGKDTDSCNQVLSESYDLLDKYIYSKMDSEESDDDDDEPMVDPCNVFRTDSLEEDEND
jgi:hypothetical protein